MTKKNLISLFAGAGGLDIGLEMAGFTTIIANEIEPYVCETLKLNKLLCNLDELEIDKFIKNALEQKCYKKLSQTEKAILFNRIKNHKNKSKYLQDAEIIEGDIREISSFIFKEKLKGNELFCIAGGPPCQPFSKAGKQKSLDCEKNGDLFFEFVRVVRDLKPKWFVFENVKGLTFTKTDVLYLNCLSCKEFSIAPFKIRQNFNSNNGSKMFCTSCNSDKTKWITKNERGGSLKIILNEFEKIGYKCASKVLDAVDFGAPQFRERLFIVGSFEGKDFVWPKPTHEKKEQSPLQGELFNFESYKKLPWKTMYEVLWSNGHPVYGEIDKHRAKLWVKNVVRPHDEPVTWCLGRPSPTIGAHQSAKLALAPNGVPEEQLYRQRWHTKGHRQGDTPPIPVEHRYLTDEELLVLQTFPRWWYLHGTRMQRASQIGNAVPPILGKIIGEAVLKSEYCK